MTDLPPLGPDLRPLDAHRLPSSAPLAGIVLNTCLYLNLEPEDADAVWENLNGTTPATTPSGLYQQILEAIEDLDLTLP